MNQTNIDFKAREKFKNRIKKGLLGPGSDTFGLPDKVELISDYPLLRYFTGILFPEKNYTTQDGKRATQAEIDLAELQNEGDTDVEEGNEENIEIPKDSIGISDAGKGIFSENGEEELKISHNSFFPTNTGFTVHVPAGLSDIKVTFSFGLYYEPKWDEIKIEISESAYQSFFDPALPIPFPLKEKLKYEGGFLHFTKPLEGNRGGKGKERSGDYKRWDAFKSKSNLSRPNNDGFYEAYYYLDKIEKIISRVWKRKPISVTLNIPIKNTEKPIIFFQGEGKLKYTRAAFNVKVIPSDKGQFVKIQLVNVSEKQPYNKFSNKNETLNPKCFFQSSIEIEGAIKEYKNNSISTFTLDNELADKEALELDFIYRNVKNYGVGHNCSVTWEAGENGKVNKVKTTFLPEQNIKDIVNTFDENDDRLNKALDIKNLSVWGEDKQTIIDRLSYFISRYENWVKKQEENNKQNQGDYRKIGEGLIVKLRNNLNRLKENIGLLNDENVFKAFQIANTAMYLQLITSNDRDFGKEEKELSGINSDIDFDSLNFFKNYDAEQKKEDGKIGFIPRYRPFQLAFLLLSLKGIVDPKSPCRKNIVDLIWFPTGGGKTEAYLAVTAFTIVYRRLLNAKGFEGTTVIMRYTLRLLTAQQFERASRLISALEFLRNQQEFKDILRDEPITIGLWVGKASTPNNLKDAKKKVEGDKDCMQAEAHKGEKGNLEDYNVFQISSCPWCGTKLISNYNSSNGSFKWKYGFECKKSDFIIKCINDNCHFSNRIPVQVVDELLYQNPPTLLFGTVDKFAMLAWQENAHRFFNSLGNNALPPDLIIQDELHLLSGPLGSITGIFESVIEKLCEKNGVGPKIIASTATTRNTSRQVENLYGNRVVNIFPPSGTTYDDSFFARESKVESKRQYLGFMPTGKTPIDTQLQLLAHLLVSRLEVYRNKETKDRTDYYWTIVSYYNSLKDVGKIFNKVGDEVSNYTSTLQYRLSNNFQPFENFTFNFFGIPGRTQELTSRVESSKIKAVLKEIEKRFDEKKIKRKKGNTYLNDVIDLVLATNMISVGIDIARMNIMLINGMPKNVAEYIQASSRVGRQIKGLVITLLDPNRAREKSYFEHFKNFHQSFYKSVEPLSVTPFTVNTLDKMLTTMMVAHVRNLVPGMAGNNQAQYFQKEMIDPLKVWIQERFSHLGSELTHFNRRIDNLAYDWQERVERVGIKRYDQLLKKPSEQDDMKREWVAMQSMREIDTNTYIRIKEVFK